MPPKKNILPNAHVATASFTNVFNRQKNNNAKLGINALAAALCTGEDGAVFTAPQYFAADGTVRPSVEQALRAPDTGYQKGMREVVAASHLPADQQATLTARIGIRPNAHVATASFTNVFNRQKNNNAKLGINALAAALCTGEDGAVFTAPQYFAADGTVCPLVEQALGAADTGYQKGMREVVAASHLPADQQATLTAYIGIRPNAHVATAGFTNVFNRQNDGNAKQGISALAAALCTGEDGAVFTAPQYFAANGTVRQSVEQALGVPDTGYQKGMREAVEASHLPADQQATLTACIGIRPNAHVATAGFTNVFNRQKNNNAQQGINALAAALCTGEDGAVFTAPQYFAANGTVRPSVKDALRAANLGYHKGMREAVAASHLPADQQATLTACIGIRPNAHVATAGFTNVFNRQKNNNAQQGINALAAALCTGEDGAVFTAPQYFAADGTGTVRPSVKDALRAANPGYQKGMREAVAASHLPADQQATLTACIGVKRTRPRNATLGEGDSVLSSGFEGKGKKRAKAPQLNSEHGSSESTSMKEDDSADDSAEEARKLRLAMAASRQMFAAEQTPLVGASSSHPPRGLGFSAAVPGVTALGIHRFMISTPSDSLYDRPPQAGSSTGGGPWELSASRYNASAPSGSYSVTESNPLSSLGKRRRGREEDKDSLYLGESLPQHLQRARQVNPRQNWGAELRGASDLGPIEQGRLERAEQVVNQAPWDSEQNVIQLYYYNALTKERGIEDAARSLITTPRPSSQQREHLSAFEAAVTALPTLRLPRSDTPSACNRDSVLGGSLPIKRESSASPSLNFMPVDGDSPDPAVEIFLPQSAIIGFIEDHNGILQPQFANIHGSEIAMFIRRKQQQYYPKYNEIFPIRDEINPRHIHKHFASTDNPETPDQNIKITSINIGSSGTELLQEILKHINVVKEAESVQKAIFADLQAMLAGQEPPSQKYTQVQTISEGQVPPHEQVLVGQYGLFAKPSCPTVSQGIIGIFAGSYIDTAGDALQHHETLYGQDRVDSYALELNASGVNYIVSPYGGGNNSQYANTAIFPPFSSGRQHIAYDHTRINASFIQALVTFTKEDEEFSMPIAAIVGHPGKVTPETEVRLDYGEAYLKRFQKAYETGKSQATDASIQKAESSTPPPLSAPLRSLRTPAGDSTQQTHASTLRRSLRVPPNKLQPKRGR